MFESFPHAPPWPHCLYCSVDVRAHFLSVSDAEVAVCRCCGGAALPVNLTRYMLADESRRDHIVGAQERGGDGQPQPALDPTRNIGSGIPQLVIFYH